MTANILIVDDIEENRDILSKLVAKLGHIAILAEGGLVALEKLKNQSIDLVLLDIMMPKITGFEVLSHITDDISLQNIPVIMITALDDMKSAENCIKMGAEDYLTKPFNRVLLKARITACLERKFLRDKEKEYLRQIEDYNLRLQELVREQTRELSIANAKIMALSRAKGNALKLIYYNFQNSLHNIFQKAVKEPIDEANKLLEMAKQFVELTKIDPSTAMFVFELNAVRSILQSAIKLANKFAKDRHVLIGSIPHCGKQALDQNTLDTMVSSEFGGSFDDDLSLSSALTWQIVADDEQNIHQKKLCANALAELIKTAIKFSRPGNTVKLSCEPLEKEISIGIHATGRTIPEQELSHFFDDPSISKEITPGRHPGAGPSIAQDIIRLLGGTVTVENQESSGISFVVKLKRENLVKT